MPIYEYRCKTCNNCFEKLVFITDDEPVVCPECSDRKVKRLLSCSSLIGTSTESGCSGNAPKGFS
ncbi:MAG TPA: zinc ribbon domain-containing protein [Desulfobacterales bacterium]|nr:zinc ribbon domain-containing protein [Desulfobacterales bacterium]HJO61363.1 zinc ribbon domain-containing protein [Desulfobacterales bacterium]